MTSSTKRIELLLNENRATATGNMYRNLRVLWTCGFLYANSQTDRQTDKHADRNTLLTYRGEVTVRNAVLSRANNTINLNSIISDVFVWLCWQTETDKTLKELRAWTGLALNFEHCRILNGRSIAVFMSALRPLAFLALKKCRGLFWGPSECGGAKTPGVCKEQFYCS